MGTARFFARVDQAVSAGQARATVASTLRPLTVVVQRATPRTTTMPQLPFVDVDGSAPAEADVWLQIWEVDRFAASRRPAAGDVTNDLLVEVPGAIVQTQAQTGTQAATFEFRAIGEATVAGTRSTELGWLRLALKDADGAAWPSEGPLEVPITGEAEDSIDLGCVLTDAAGRDAARSASASSNWPRASVFHAQNLTRVVGTMLEAGGLSIGFWADLNNPEDLGALAQYRAAHRPIPATETAMRAVPLSEFGSTRNLYDVLNDREFDGSQQYFTEHFGALKLNAAGELLLGCFPFKDQPFNSYVASSIQGVVDKVHEEFQESEGDPPKVKHLLLFTHGWSTGIRTGRADARQMAVRQIPGLLQPLLPLLATDVVVSLYACSTALGPHDPIDGARFWWNFGGTAPAGFTLGQDGFAWTIWSYLHDNGCGDAAVWAHVTYGPASTNTSLRCFSASFAPENARDVLYMREGATRPETAADQSRAVQTFHREFHRRSDDVRRIAFSPPDEVADIMGPAPAPPPPPAGRGHR